MSAHMDYFSEQLIFFYMAESDEECMDKLPEMQCLPNEMIKIFSSTKRSLLDTLEQTESEKKGKFQEESSKWGPVLSIRPTTRGHGDIGIMDKAKEYQKKKNLEIPKTFKGRSWRSLACILVELRTFLRHWAVLCDATQEELLRQFVAKLDKFKGELLRIAWL